jgi:hypothetical protein
VANEGIGATPGEHLLLADDPAGMATTILGLFADPDRAARMGTAARSFVEKAWTWEAHFLRLEAEMFNALDEREAAINTPVPTADSAALAVDNSNCGDKPYYPLMPTT